MPLRNRKGLGIYILVPNQYIEHNNPKLCTMIYFLAVYSLFSACEYLVVFTNIAFHGTTIIDFEGTVNTIAPSQLVGDKISKRYR